MRRTVSLFLVVAMVSAMVAVPARNARASMDSYVNQSLSDLAGAASSINPTWTSDQQANYLSLGGFRSRTNLGGAIRPVSITMPTISAGCGGIDLNWGGMAVLQVKYIIQAFKHILQAAPSMAFNLAFSTLCQSCEAIMSKLRAFADKINAMTMDKCKTAGMLGGMMLDGLNQLGLSDLTGGVKSYFDEITTVKGNTLGEWANKAENWLNTGAVGKYLNCDPVDIVSNPNLSYNPSDPASCGKKGQKLAMKEPGSILHFAMEDAKFDSALGNTDEFEAVLRGIIGDVVITDDRKTETSQPATGPSMKVTVEEPMQSITLTDLWMAMYWGTGNAAALASVSAGSKIPAGAIGTSQTQDKLPGRKCVHPKAGDNHCKMEKVDVNISAGMYTRMTNAYVNILDALLSRTDPSASDLALLNLAPFPAYKYINTLTLMKEGSAVNNVKQIADAAAVLVTNHMFEDVFNRIFVNVGGYLNQIDRAKVQDPTVGEVRVWYTKVIDMYKTVQAYAEEKRSRSEIQVAQADSVDKAIRNLEANLLKGAVNSSLRSQILATQAR